MSAGKQLCVTVPVPPSTNNCYVNSARGRHLTESAGRFKDGVEADILAVALAQKFSCAATDRFALALDIYFADGHRRDISNTIKLVEDSLAHVLGFDDCRVDDLRVRRRGIDPDNPRCEVTLTILENSDEQTAAPTQRRAPKSGGQAPPPWGRISSSDFRRLNRGGRLTARR
jgi:Holliday junction resolvase RusA-like endonuclease